jgi:hypothetical protein
VQNHKNKSVKNQLQLNMKESTHFTGVTAGRLDAHLDAMFVVRCRNPRRAADQQQAEAEVIEGHFETMIRIKSQTNTFKIEMDEKR